MLDPSLCPRPHSRWVGFTSLISHTFTTTAIPWSVRVAVITLLILGFFFLLRLIRTQRRRHQRPRLLRWHRRLTWGGIALTVIGLLATSPPGVTLATQALVSSVPMTSDHTADAIVVLGRGPKLRADRVEVAFNLWRQEQAPRIFLSGWGDAWLMMTQLRERGVAEQALGGEECSMTTEENGRFTASILRPQGVQKILLVTDPPHMLRSLLTFKQFGFEVFPSATPMSPELSYREKAAIAFREYGGLISYVLQGRLFSQR